MQHLRLIQEKLNSFISVSKHICYSRMSVKLTKFHRSSKAYWSLLKTFLYNKKIPLIWILPSRRFYNRLFNSFFASQCSLLKNDSKLPPHLNYKTYNRLLTVNFSIDDIAKVLQNLDSNKVTVILIKSSLAWSWQYQYSHATIMW